MNIRAMPSQSIATVRAQDLFIRPTAARTRIRNTNCSRLEIAKRGIKKILDANNDGSVTDPVDQNTLNMRMGYMRFYNCGK